MAEPSFNGADIFGPCPVSNRVEEPNARQINAYPGVAGVESIELGTRTSATVFSGIWCAETPDDLGFFLGQMIALKRNGGFATLVDTLGVASPDAILENFTTTNETQYFPGYGWGVEYQMRFLHLGFVPSP